MIGRLTGTLTMKRAPQIMIDCAGVGYDVEVPMSTFYQLPETGEKIALWTHLLIRDDEHALIGFYQETERKLFRLLIKVNGVGPKMALTILSGISDQEFALCIQQGDVATLTRLPGVGKKTAERLIIEMRDKLDSLVVSVTGSAQPASQSRQVADQDQAIEALQALGYRPADATKMIAKAVQQQPEAGCDEWIRLALKQALS